MTDTGTDEARPLAVVTAGSLVTKAQGIVNKVLPDRLKAAAHRQMAEPRSGE